MQKREFSSIYTEGLKRQIVSDYEKTLVVQNFTFSGTKTFTLERAVSMSPQEKLKVTINDSIQQHLFDFTVNGNTLTISKAMNIGDIIKTTIKI